MLLHYFPGTGAAHYDIAFFADLSDDSNFQAARRLVHVDPYPLEILVRPGFVHTIFVFGVPGNGDCLFACFFIAWKSGLSSWQPPDGEHFEVSSTLSCPPLRKEDASGRNWPLALREIYSFTSSVPVKQLLSTACTENGGHA